MCLYIFPCTWYQSHPRLTTLIPPKHCSSFFFSSLMADITAFTSTEKTTHNSHKFGFKLSSNNYGYWKAMFQSFLVTNNLFCYPDGSIQCPPETITSAQSGKSSKTTTAIPQPLPNPSYIAWICNDTHIRMLITSTISE